jgi:hypothetical protein
VDEKLQLQLKLASLLGIVLFTVHITDDIIRGMSPGTRQDVVAILILVVWLCGALPLAGRRSGLIITLLGGIFAFAMPLLHLGGAGVGVGTKTAEYAAGFRFIFVLMAIGTVGLFSVILSIHGLWKLRAVKGQ